MVDDVYVWVATVDTRYEVMAVANTEATATQLAAQRALRYLRDANAVTQETNTAAKIIEYFGVRTTRIKVGTAVLAD